MSEQVHKTLLACDELNRTGQKAPAIHDRNRETGKCLPVDAGRVRGYNLGGRTNGKGCQKWEDGRRRCDDVHTKDRCQEQNCGNTVKVDEEMLKRSNAVRYLFSEKREAIENFIDLLSP